MLNYGVMVDLEEEDFEMERMRMQLNWEEANELEAKYKKENGVFSQMRNKSPLFLTGKSKCEFVYFMPSGMKYLTRDMYFWCFNLARLGVEVKVISVDNPVPLDWRTYSVKEGAKRATESEELHKAEIGQEEIPF